jgi:hypothetical protein
MCRRTGYSRDERSRDRHDSVHHTKDSRSQTLPYFHKLGIEFVHTMNNTGSKRARAS